MVNPLPVKLIKDFAAKVKTLYVIEELDDVIETHCRKNGIDVKGKELFTLQGEYFQSKVDRSFSVKRMNGRLLMPRYPFVLPYSVQDVPTEAYSTYSKSSALW